MSNLQRYRKGYRNEQKSIRILESCGYEVIRAGASRGHWDLVALNSQETRLIQVKSNRDISNTEKEILRKLKYPVYASKELWIWLDHKREPIIELL